jgi:hypothetical protein
MNIRMTIIVPYYLVLLVGMVFLSLVLCVFKSSEKCKTSRGIRC